MNDKCYTSLPDKHRIFMKLNTRQRRQLRGLGHSLSPVVSIAEAGLKETVITATEEALDAHELIKIKMRSGSRERNKSLLDDLCEKTNAVFVSKTGFTALLFRRNRNKPKIELMR